MTTTAQCQWIGAGEGCKHTALEGRSYCAEHIHRVYQAGSAQRKRKKDLRVANAVWDIEQAFQEAVEELEAEGYDLADERWIDVPVEAE